MKNCGIELVTMKSKIKLLITGCMGRMGKQLIKTSNKDKLNVDITTKYDKQHK